MARKRTTNEVPGNGQWLTVKQVAERLGVSRETVGRWIYSGQIRAVDLSARASGTSKRTCWRVNCADLHTFLETRASAPAPRPRRARKHQLPDIIEFIK